MRYQCLLVVIMAITAEKSIASPFADSVVSYEQGVGVAEEFTDPTAALGEPTRFTSPDSEFGGAVTPFNSPFGNDEIVSLGEGGQLTVQFDSPVEDDLRNPFGIDLLIFGNSFQALGGDVFAEGGVVEVSADGIDFTLVPEVVADGAFPTLGYQDLAEPFPATAGSVLTDFTRPVDPSFDPTGLDITALSIGYGGSGGGAGIDLASVGLTEISYVRISNPVGSGVTPEIDALADVSPVPEPAAALQALVLASLATSLIRRFATH